MKPMIHSTKHYVQLSLSTILEGAKLTTNLAVATQNADAADEVDIGSTIKAIYVEMWLKTLDTIGGTALATLYKTPGGLASMSFAEQVNLHDYENKKNVLYHTQGLTNETDSIATPFMRQWFKIPKGKQRMAQGDTLRLNISAQVLDQGVCGFATYKAYV